MLAMEELINDFIAPVVSILKERAAHSDTQRAGVDSLKQVRDLVYRSLFHPPLMRLA
jgi:hypothetical protein